MAVVGSQVAVGDAAVTVVAGEGADGARATVRNADGGPSVFLGGAGLTAANGFELKAGSETTVELAPGETLRGITSAGSSTVHVLKTKG